MRRTLVVLCAGLLCGPVAAADFGPQPGGWRTNKTSGSPFRQGLNASASSFFGPLIGAGTRNDYMPLYAGYGTARGTIVAESVTGEIAVTGASRNTDASSVNAASIGGAFFDFNFRTGAGNQSFGWALYSEARHLAGAGQALGYEMDATEFGTASVNNPYNMLNFTTGGVWLVAGGGCIATSPCWNGTSQTGVAQDASFALGINTNSAKFQKGIVIGAAALTGCTGTSGSCNAMEMGRYARVAWDDEGGTQRASIFSSIAAGSGYSIVQEFAATGVVWSAPIRPLTSTVAGLPACNNAGMQMVVTDANAPAYGGTPAGGGGTTASVICNGGTASWKYN